MNDNSSIFNRSMSSWRSDKSTQPGTHSIIGTQHSAGSHIETDKSGSFVTGRYSEYESAAPAYEGPVQEGALELADFQIMSDESELRRAGYNVKGGCYFPRESAAPGKVFHSDIPLCYPASNTKMGSIVDKIAGRLFENCPVCHYKENLPVPKGDGICSESAKHQDLYGDIVKIMADQRYNRNRYIGVAQTDDLVDNLRCQAPVLHQSSVAYDEYAELITMEVHNMGERPRFKGKAKWDLNNKDVQRCRRMLDKLQAPTTTQERY